jgi:hypothetical protein
MYLKKKLRFPNHKHRKYEFTTDDTQRSKEERVASARNEVVSHPGSGKSLARSDEAVPTTKRKLALVCP